MAPPLPLPSNKGSNQRNFRVWVIFWKCDFSRCLQNGFPHCSKVTETSQIAQWPWVQNTILRPGAGPFGNSREGAEEELRKPSSCQRITPLEFERCVGNVSFANGFSRTPGVVMTTHGSEYSPKPETVELGLPKQAKGTLSKESWPVSDKSPDSWPIQPLRTTGRACCGSWSVPNSRRKHPGTLTSTRLATRSLANQEQRNFSDTVFGKPKTFSKF